MTVDEIIVGLKNLYGEPMGLCNPYVHAIADTFPELKPVYGVVTLRTGLTVRHWWLVDSDGRIIDPTASQFETEYFWYAGIQSYRAFSEEELRLVDAEEASLGHE